MSRNYTSIRPKLDRVYSVEQVVSLYSICRNTLGNSIASGLLPPDANQPRIFRGAELARFHQERAGIKTPLRRGKFKCMSCKARVFPDLSTLRFLIVSQLMV
ncbi:hypothetical protein [Thioclava kandeliae]|uniref:DNA-binding protein n=1 Tax=Thioclava kandeliae TaxID=3070818 RepID=A0ABV1SG99_9RHOB